MTLDDAITHAREVAAGCGECAEEHAQLADWLDELRALKALKDDTCELIAGLKEDKRRSTGYKLTGIYCSKCGEQHSGAVAFQEDGSYAVFREELDVYCRRCGSRITNEINKLTQEQVSE